MEIIRKYFPDPDSLAESRLEKLFDLYSYWNSRINVISRKDMENFYERHVLHSISIAKIFSFEKGTEILDVGTGGGFPGIPLAILFPEVKFLLVDSIGKKINVVNSVVEELKLENVFARQARAENLWQSFDFVISRAVAGLPEFVSLIGNRVASQGINSFPNGIIYLKGGDFLDELKEVKGWENRLYDLSEMFDEPFFQTKKVVYLTRNKNRAYPRKG